MAEPNDERLAAIGALLVRFASLDRNHVGFGDLQGLVERLPELVEDVIAQGLVFFDAIRVKIRNEGMVNNRAVYLPWGYAVWASKVFSRGDHHGVSQTSSPDLHRASDPLLDALRRVEGTPAGSARAQTDLPG